MIFSSKTKSAGLTVTCCGPCGPPIAAAAAVGGDGSDGGGTVDDEPPSGTTTTTTALQVLQPPGHNTKV